jgi:Raf kinase inhibitor-like YbhB/YbcL family protein
MRLNSSAFADGSAIPRRFTCDGDDLSPPLSWSDAPPGTRSFVLLCDDPDAPAGTWHHWAAYDIPSTLTALAERAASDAERGGFKQAINDFQRSGYGGPCPPRGPRAASLPFSVARAFGRSSVRRPHAVLS